jgi:hypothetical protein
MLRISLFNFLFANLVTVILHDPFKQFDCGRPEYFLLFNLQIVSCFIYYKQGSTGGNLYIYHTDP